MTQIAGLVLLRVRLEPLLARPLAHGVAQVVAEICRQPALADVEHLVPPSRPVEAERRAFRRPRERVLELVAVVEDLRLAGENLLEWRLRDPGEALQGVAYLRLLLRELRLVAEILEAAPAARGEMRARRVDALGARP